MTEEQINIAIAESLGWSGIIYVEATDNWVGNKPGGGRFRFPVKKYTASLDACAEFEKTMTPEQGKTYVGLFDEVCGGELSLSDMADSPQEYLFWCIRATPPQKCEAYLRTIGKWTPSNQQPT